MKQARDQIVDFLRAELIGPDPQNKNVQANGEEILVGDPPRIRYGAGVLFPQTVVAEVAEDISPTESLPQQEMTEPTQPEITVEESADPLDELNQVEETVALANAYLPSALGFSCFAEVPANGFVVSVGAGQYRKVDREYEVRGEKKIGSQYERVALTEKVPVSSGELLAARGESGRR